MFFVILCTGLLTMAVLVRYRARSEEVVLQGETRRIRILTRHFGLELTASETLESVRGVYPVSFQGRVGAVAIYESDGELSYRVLMDSSAQDASVLFPFVLRLPRRLAFSGILALETKRRFRTCFQNAGSRSALRRSDKDRTRLCRKASSAARIWRSFLL